MASNIKDEARRLLENLPEDSSWDDLMRQVYVRQAIEAGIAASKAGRTVSVGEVRKRFDLPK